MLADVIRKEVFQLKNVETVDVYFKNAVELDARHKTVRLGIRVI